MDIIYLVRHAHSDWTTDENRRLSPKGEEDSNHVAGILQIFPIIAIYSSPFNRAYETIIPLSKRLNIPIIIEPNLRERSVGANTITDFNKSVEALWRDPLLSYPNGESNKIAQRRGIEVLHRLHMSNLTGQIVISTHGNLLALILNYYNSKVDYEFWKNLTTPDIYAININNKEEVSVKRLWKEK